MSVLCCLELIACIEVAVKDKAAAHTCSDEEADNILVALSRAELILTEHADINVVADIERAAELVFDRLSDVVILPGKIGREKNDALLLVDDAGSTCSDSMNIALLDTGGIDKFFYDIDDDFFNVL